jgi:hypothetical protein
MRFHSRRLWITLVLVGLVTLVEAGARKGRAGDEFTVEEGFISLFNGKDLSGWRLGQEPLDGKTETADHRFAAKDGAIAIQGAAPIEDLYTVREFGRDFVLRLEFRAGPRANSGLYIRGKQLQVRDYPTIGPYKTLKQFQNGGWNAIEVTVRGETAECTCNGETLEKALAVPPKGGIGLQSETGQIEYRRIRIQEQR